MRFDPPLAGMNATLDTAKTKSSHCIDLFKAAAVYSSSISVTFDEWYMNDSMEPYPRAYVINGRLMHAESLLEQPLRLVLIPCHDAKAK